MSYTVIGLFRDRSNAEQAKNDLNNSGFDTDRVDYSTYRDEGEFHEYDYEYYEDDRSRGFWDELFTSDAAELDEENRHRYSRMGARSNVVTVHTDDLDEAERAQHIMDTAGSINVKEYDQLLSDYRTRFNESNDYDQSFEEFVESNPEYSDETLTGEVRSRIVNRRISDENRLREERVYQKRNRLGENEADDRYRGGIL